MREKPCQRLSLCTIQRMRFHCFYIKGKIILLSEKGIREESDFIKKNKEMKHGFILLTIDY